MMMGIYRWTWTPKETNTQRTTTVDTSKHLLPFSKLTFDIQEAAHSS